MPQARSISIIRGGILSLAALAGAAYAASFSLRSAERYGEGTAPGLYSGDGIVRLRSVFLQVAENQSYQINSADAAAIKSTLIERPLNAQALSVTGLGWVSASGSDQAGNRFMELADRVSRRDALSQVWMIEAASTSGNVREAIRHYNAALSVKPELGATLFPVLLSALDFAEVRNALQAPIAASAKWMPAFISAASASADLDSLWALVAPSAAKLRGDEYKQDNASIIYRLAAAGRQVEAMNYAQRVFPGFSARAFTQFAASPLSRDDRLGSLAWRLTDNENIAASSDAEGTVAVEVQPSAQGPIMSRDVIVTGGRQYGFTQTVQRGAGPAPSSLRWQATCPGNSDGAIVWSQLVPTGEQAVKYKSTFAVPSNCHILRMELLVLGPEGQLTSSIKILDLSFLPI